MDDGADDLSDDERSEKLGQGVEFAKRDGGGEGTTLLHPVVLPGQAGETVDEAMMSLYLVLECLVWSDEVEGWGEETDGEGVYFVFAARKKRKRTCGGVILVREEGWGFDRG